MCRRGGKGTSERDMNKSFNSTAAGQKAMFYAAHDVVAADNRRKMANISYAAGVKAATVGRPALLPKNADYMAGFNSVKK